MNKINIIKIIIILFFIQINLLLFSLDTISLDDSVEQLPISLYLEYFEDKENKLTIDDVVKPEYSEKFIQNIKKDFSLKRFSSSNFWVRFKLKNNSKIHIWLIEVAYPFINNIEFYYKDNSGTYNIKKTGLELPFKSRDIKHRNYIFKIPIDYNSEDIYYISFNMQSNIFLPLKIYSYDYFLLKDHNDQILLGLYYGMMLLMLISNIIIFIIICDKSYFYYILFVIFWILAQLDINGISFEYLWPNFPWWNSKSLILFLNLYALCILLFMNIFLSTNKNVPIIHKFVLIFKIITVINIILSFFIKYSIGIKIIAFLGIIMIIVIFIIGIICLLKGYKPARVFLLAWSLFLIGIFFHALTVSGIIPNNNLTRIGLQISSILLIILIPVALADKINIMKKEKALADKTIAEKEKDKFASIGMLLGGISHEIYNPLSGITGPLDNLKKIIDKPIKQNKDKIKKYIEYIEKNTQRIDNIIKNVRALYKKEKFEKEKLDINEIVLSVIDNYKNDVNKNINFEYKIDKKIEIYGDKNAVYQILNNLVSNAIDAINKIDKHGKIIITLEKDNKNKIIKVIDNGSGIIDTNIDKIFNAFYSTKTIGNNIGLGLYIVKDLIIKLGWDIKVDSDEGKGTTFSIIVKE